MPVEYKLVFTDSFLKDLKKLPKKEQKKIIEHIEKTFLQDPFYRVVKLEGLKIGKYRTRVGDYRARFDIEQNKIIFCKIKHRKEIYKE